MAFISIISPPQLPKTSITFPLYSLSTSTTASSIGSSVRPASSVLTKTREWFFGTPQTPDCPTLMDQWEDWQPLLAGRRLVAHNIATERTILTRVAPLTKWGPWTDTLKLAKARYPRLPSYALGDLCAMFGLVPQFESRTWHDGLYDAIACAKLAMFLSF